MIRPSAAVLSVGLSMIPVLVVADAGGDRCPDWRVGFTGGDLTARSLTFESIPGAAYRVQAAPSPGGEWADVGDGPTVATGPLTEISIPDGLLDDASGFFRVVRLNRLVFDFAIEVVDTGDLVGTDVSLAIGGAGSPFIAYSHFPDLATRAARHDGTSWGFESIAPTFPNGTSAAHDPEGRPAVAFQDGVRLDLVVARRLGEAWERETVDRDGDTGRFASLAFGPDQRPAVSYHDATNGDLKFARHDGMRWTIEAVDTEGNVGSHTSLAFAPDGSASIAYRDETNGDLRFARRTDAGWEILVVDAAGDVGRHASLAYPPGGEPAIAYFDQTNGDLKLASRFGAAWRTETVASEGVVGGYCSLAFDARGQAMIAYYDFADMDLEFAARCGPAWTLQTVDAGGAKGAYCSLALTPDGLPAIAYYDGDAQGLRYARATGVIVEPLDP